MKIDKLKKDNIFKLFGLVLVLGLAGSGCGKKQEAGYGPMVVNVVAYKGKAQAISDKISLVGTLKANEEVEIKSEIDGVVEEINFEEGDRVKKGHVLFKIDEKKLKATLAQAEANLKLAESTSQRYKALIESKAVSQQEYDQTIATLEASRASVDLTKEELNDATIEAPFDGVMGGRSVSIGQFISKGTMLSHLVNQDPMKAEFHVPERYLSRIATGQKIEIKVAAYPDQVFPGEVYFIEPSINELTRTALVKAYVANPDRKLRGGMFANLNLIVQVKENAVVVPEKALIVLGDTVSVFIIDENNIVHLKAIQTGIRFDGNVEVVSGLASGEVVVTEGYQKLGEGSQVNPRFEESAE